MQTQDCNFNSTSVDIISVLGLSSLRYPRIGVRVACGVRLWTAPVHLRYRRDEIRASESRTGAASP